MKKNILSTIIICTIFMTTVVTAQETQKEIQERDFQIGFISPIGTNGIESHLIINKISINILGGYSYGNTILEFGGLYNVNTNITKGAQFAGITNYSGNADNAVQFAGIANIATKGTIVAQFGGIANMAKDLNGTQIGGIINIAKKVKGIQIGLINCAEESDGLSIGLINIVKNGGKYEFEISFSEAINTAASFRLGTDKFYTIFSAGINYINTPNAPVEYATGIGFGTHINWKNGWSNQVELMGYSLTEEGRYTRNMNTLNQLKFTFSKELSKHFKVFAGPVLNMTISDYVNQETGEMGSSIATWSMWKNDSNRVRLNSWIGFTAGIRF